MFKIFHKFFDSAVFTRPSVHYIQPKALNIYFKNAIKPQYQLINLTKYDRFSIEINSVKDNENNIFQVNLLAFVDAETEIITVGEFETKTEAQEAVILLKNKLFSPEKTSIKLIYILALLFFIVTFSFALVEATLLSNGQPQQANNAQMLQLLRQQANLGNLPQIAPQNNITQQQAFEQLQLARQQANKAIEDGTRNSGPAMPTPQASPAPVIEIPLDPAVKDFMGGLDK